MHVVYNFVKATEIGRGFLAKRLRVRERTKLATHIHGLTGVRALSGSRSPESVNTLTERVYQAMKTDIVTGVLHAGAAVTEKDLATMYNSSRTPVREAAQRLQQDNLLRIVPNRGYFVSSLTIQEVNDMYEYRAVVEGGCAELAATRGVPQAMLAELFRLARTKCQASGRSGYARFIEADTAFHVAIARLTHNELMVRAVSNLRCHTDKILFAAANVLDMGYYGDVPVREHCAILEAIRRGDSQAARKLICDHILGAKQKILQVARGGFRLP
jgi:DNA-binding GntR family transcriptional regulator